MKTLILIPARMASKRFPNKPMALINGKPMIERVWETAISSKLGDVIVACSEKAVFDHIVSVGGKAQMTNPDLPSGTDRIYEAIRKYKNIDNIESIINLQGDMPYFKSNELKKVNIPLMQGFEIGTLVTDLKKNQIKDKNITKVQVNWIKKKNIGKAVDFSKFFFDSSEENIYHHVGIYSFRYESLKKFISKKQSINEIKRSLEQLRAIDNKMSIGVSYVDNFPISVDTLEDLKKIENLINKSDE